MPSISSSSSSSLDAPQHGARIAPASHVHVTTYDVAKRLAVSKYVEQLLRSLLPESKYADRMLRPLLPEVEYVERMLRPRLHGADSRRVTSGPRLRRIRKAGAEHL